MKICIVCIANFCRSPVAENILKIAFPEHEFYSAGIHPIAKPGMDNRSLDFLKSIDITPEIHIPKKINNNMLEYFDIFLAIDFLVLSELNKAFPKYKKKYRLFTSQFSDMIIYDPYNLDTKKYNKIMNDIDYVSKRLNLNIL